MGINLTKGANINLSKTAPGVTQIKVGLGWDTNSYDTGGSFDLDASVALLTGDKLTKNENFVFYNNVKDPSGAVEHSGDNLTGEGAGDDEVVKINLAAIPNDVDKIRFAVTIHEAATRNQNFGMVQNAYIRIENPATGEEIVRYDLTEDFSIETCIVPGEFYKHNGEWKFKAVGAGFGGGLEAYVTSIS